MGTFTDRRRCKYFLFLGPLMKKLMLISGLGLVFFLCVFFNSIFNSMDTAVHLSIEKHASRILQVPVKIKKVDINPFDGEGIIEGLSVESPMGFESPYVIKLKKIIVKLDVNATSDYLVFVKEIIFDHPQIFYEIKENTSNLEMIDQNIMSQQIHADSKTAGIGHEDGNKKSLKLIIANFHIKNAQVVLINTQSQETNKTLPAIHLQDIGRDSDGATPMEATWPVISNLAESIVNMLGGSRLPASNSITDNGEKEVFFSSRDDLQESENKKAL